MSGIVVANINTGEFSPGYKTAEWTYLGSGILVETEEAGLVHLPEPIDAILSRR